MGPTTPSSQTSPHLLWLSSHLLWPLRQSEGAGRLTVISVLPILGIWSWARKQETGQHWIHATAGIPGPSGYPVMAQKEVDSELLDIQSLQQGYDPCPRAKPEADLVAFAFILREVVPFLSMPATPKPPTSSYLQENRASYTVLGSPHRRQR